MTDEKRVSATWLIAKLNAMDEKLDMLLESKPRATPRVTQRKPEKPAPKPKERVIYDATSDSYYAVPIEEKPCQ